MRAGGREVGMLRDVREKEKVVGGWGSLLGRDQPMVCSLLNLQPPVQLSGSFSGRGV